MTQEVKPKTHCYPHINVPIVWVLGGPGTGKGTQCAKIVAKFGFTHISTGELLRDEIKRGSDKGKKLKSMMEKGDLVPNDVVLELLRDAMLNNLCSSKGFLIDGYPREKEQGLMFEKKIAPPTFVLYLESSDKTMMDRLMNRAKSSNRSDDNETTMKKRIKKFHQENDAILKQYASKLKTINAERDVNSIFRDVEIFFNPLVG